MNIDIILELKEILLKITIYKRIISNKGNILPFIKIIFPVRL